ncbi:hypothetical protein THRCLA_03393 [Thraustotheca clavata]|uniref:Transmembrane protein n=1 Tax=Thraustotheca clavata TaxID=74557 RepID=A0A1W0A2F5_9STRA|nr:hypothetical protein THRCLA_03393 [Thraustotheca clavata]
MAEGTQVNEWIMSANAPPPKDSTLKDLVRDYEKKRYEERQFAQIQSQTHMDLSMLQFISPYEEEYTLETQEASLNRIRAVFLFGFLLYAGLICRDYFVEGLYQENTTILLILNGGIALPVLLLGFLLTFIPTSHLALERITCIVFFTVASVMIANKPIRSEHGPILPLMLLFVPIFGITRMRFVTSCSLGVSILILYMVVQLLAAAYLDGVDSGRDIMYQVFNYSIRVFGGVVSHYRQELLRRRNYALQLPFTGLVDGDICAQNPSQYSKRTLLHRGTLSFRHPLVEASFYRFWYLIDPFPFENIHNPRLHRGVFSTIRYALISVLISQCFLAFQDAKLLPSNLQNVAWITRFAVVVPGYIIMSCAIYILSHWFASQVTSTDEDCTIDIQDEDKPLSFRAYIARRFTDIILLNDKGGYVRYAQMLAGFVVMLHIGAMAALVLVVYDDSTTRSLTDLYFMGLLNALLFVHRSGFRVRFVHATSTTAIAVIAFVTSSWYYLSMEVWLEYSFYTIAVLALGGVISYEEESLRRSFFILKSIRTVQFQKWLVTIVQIQGWIRAKLRQKLKKLREAKPGEQTERDATATQLARATRVGVYSQVVQVIAEVI